MFANRKSNMRSSFLSASRLSVLCVALGVIAACAGGGTSGSDTAGRSANFSGEVVDPQGTPRERVGVTLLETGDSDETDTTGKFAFEAQEFEGSTATLEFRDDALTAQLVIPDLPQQNSVDVEVDVEADSGTQSVRSKRVKVTERTPTPRPTARPTSPQDEPTPQPTPQPTSGGVIPSPVPSTPAVDATATPRPTAPQPEPTTTSRPTWTPAPTRTPSVEPTPTETPLPARWLLSGMLVDRRGLPISGATVSVVETGASGVTSSGGEFSLSTSVPGTQARIMVTVNGISGRAQLSGLPERAARIVLAIAVRNALNPPPSSLTLSVDVVSVE